MKVLLLQLTLAFLVLVPSTLGFVPATSNAIKHQIIGSTGLSMASPGETSRRETSKAIGAFLAAAVLAAPLGTTVPTASAIGGDPYVEVDEDDDAGSPPYAPPKISTMSSPRAMALSDEMEGLNPKLYGAFWCPHCTDQKATMGKEAFAKVKYIECSKDGMDAQVKLCRSKKLPGYPTWEIGGRLFPGEKDLEELEEIVKEVKASTPKDVPKPAGGLFGNWFKRIDII